MRQERQTETQMASLLEHSERAVSDPKPRFRSMEQLIEYSKLRGLSSPNISDPSCRTMEGLLAYSELRSAVGF